MTELFWRQLAGEQLAQGDMLPGCAIPIISPGFGSNISAAVDSTEPIEVEAVESDLIIVTQSCDLENKKVELVACCPIFSLEEFEEINPNFKTTGEWERVRKGQIEGLHLLASPAKPEDQWAALVVDFKSIHSLPIDYLASHASGLGVRWRLRSPFLEHFSQAFARFFMRVGLPSTISTFAKQKRPTPHPPSG